MGKGLQSKQEQQYETKRNKVLQAEADSLIGRIPPATEQRIEIACSSSDLLPGATLVARPSSDGEFVEFLQGETVRGTTERAIAEQMGVALESTLFQVVSNEDGVACLRVLPLDRKRLRPLVDGDV